MFHHHNYHFAPFTGSPDSFGYHYRHQTCHPSSSFYASRPQGPWNGRCHRGYYHPFFACFPLKFARFLFGIAATTLLFSFVFKVLVLFLAILLSPPAIFLGIGAFLATLPSHASFSETSQRGSQRNSTCPFTRKCSKSTNASPPCKGRGLGWCGGAATLRRCALDSYHSKEESSNEVQEESLIKEKVIVNTGIHREETEKNLKISLDVPGFETNEITVSVEDENRLALLGTRVNRIGDTFEVKESFALDPEVYDHDTIKVELSDGVLDILIEKKPAPKPRIIAISTK